MLGKWLLMSLGILAMVVGLIGVVVPLLPTTPFLLLAAACFVRSSDTLYDRLTSNRLLGGFIRDYREQRGVTARAKITALVVLWGVIGYTALMVVDLIWVRVLLGGVAVGVTIHLLRMKTLPRTSRPLDRGLETTAAAKDEPTDNQQVTDISERLDERGVAVVTQEALE